MKEHRRLLDLADLALNSAAAVERELSRRLPPDDPDLLKLMKKPEQRRRDADGQ